MFGLFEMAMFSAKKITFPRLWKWPSDDSVQWDVIGRHRVAFREGKFRESCLKEQAQLFTFCSLPFLLSMPGKKFSVGNYRKDLESRRMIATCEGRWRVTSRSKGLLWHPELLYKPCSGSLRCLITWKGEKTNLFKPLLVRFLLHVANPILTIKLMPSTLK